MALAVLAWRITTLSDVDPRSDHAYFSVWLEDVMQAPRLLPRVEATESWSEALALDRSSAASQLLRRIYNEPFRLYNLGTFATYYGAARALGTDFRDLVRISIVASVAIALLLTAVAGSLGALDPSADRRTYPWTAALTAALALSSFYLHLFSAQGWHNVALAWMLAHLLASLRIAGLLLRGDAPSRTAWALGLLTLAPMLYSYYVLPWLVIPAIFAQLAVAWPRSRRAMLSYAGACALLAALSVPVLLVVPEQAAENISQSQFTWSSLGNRAWGWFAESSALISGPGLIGALLGVVALVDRGIVFPLVVVFGHFALWATSNAVGTVASYRSILYLLPYLLLGLAYLTVWAVVGALSIRDRRRKLLSIAAILICIGSYSLRQAVALASPKGACRWIPSYCQQYVEGMSLRAIIAGIDRQLPPGAPLAPGTYALQYIYRVLTHRTDVAILPPINQIISNYEKGDVETYAKERGVGEMRSDVLWILVRQDEGDEQQRKVGEVFGPSGLGLFDAVLEPETVEVWDTEIPNIGILTLAALRQPVKLR